jgi:hypothetical protein
MLMIHLYHEARLIVVITLLGLAGPAHAELFPRPCDALGPKSGPKTETSLTNATICASMPAANER